MPSGRKPWTVPWSNIIAWASLSRAYLQLLPHCRRQITVGAEVVTRGYVVTWVVVVIRSRHVSAVDVAARHQVTTLAAALSRHPTRARVAEFAQKRQVRLAREFVAVDQAKTRARRRVVVCSVGVRKGVTAVIQTSTARLAIVTGALM